MPERQREAVRLLVLEEQSLSEAAVATRRSKGALKVNLHRALNSDRIVNAPCSAHLALEFIHSTIEDSDERAGTKLVGY